MKAFTLTILALGLSTILLASAPPLEKSSPACLVTPVLTQRLQGGVWQGQDANGEAVSVIFYKNGLAQWSKTNNPEPVVELYEWQAIAVDKGCAFLQLIDQQSGTISTYVVEVVHNQLHLIAEGASGMALEQIKTKQDSHRRRMLSGTWGNSTYPFEISRQQGPDLKGAYLQYQFSEDGSFVRRLGNLKREVREAGTYLVSEDGAYILLQFDNGCVTVVALKYLQWDELVLQHVLRCEDPAFSTGRKDFYFNKL